MIKQIFFTTIFLFILLSQSVSEEFDLNTGESLPLNAGNGQGVYINYGYKLNLSTLLGEPVIRLNVKTEIDRFNSVVTVPDLTIGLTAYEKIDLRSLDYQAAKLISLYDMTLQFEFGIDNRSFFIIADAGAIAVPDGQTLSFNPPGSPDWSKLFLKASAPTTRHKKGMALQGISNTKYVSDETAKYLYDKILKNELDFPVKVSMIAVQVSEYDLHNWVRNRDSKPDLVLLESGIQTVQQSLRTIFGYQLPDSAIKKMSEKIKNEPAASRFDRMMSYFAAVGTIAEEHSPRGNYDLFKADMTKMQEALKRQRKKLDANIRGWRSSDQDPNYFEKPTMSAKMKKLLSQKPERSRGTMIRLSQ